MTTLTAVALAGPDGKPGDGSSAFDNLDSALRDFLAELVHTYDFTGKQVQSHGTSSCMQQHPHVPGQLLCCALLSSAGSTMDAHVGTSQWSCMEKYANALAAALLCSALLCSPGSTAHTQVSYADNGHSGPFSH